MVNKIAKWRMVSGLLALMVMLTASVARADYFLMLTDAGGNIFYSSSWNGSTTDFTDSNSGYKGTFTLTAKETNSVNVASVSLDIAQKSTNPATSLAKLNYQLFDNNLLGPLDSHSKFSADVANFGTGDFISVQGSFYPFDKPATNLFVSSDGSKGPPSASTYVDASSQFRLSAINGFVTFGSFDHNLTTTLTVERAPEPASLVMGLIGIPCIGGIARFVRRRFHKATE